MGSEEETTYRKGVEQSLARIERKTDDGFAGVYTRQDKTNGNVRTLQIWRAYITGGLTILSILVVPLFIWFITHKIG